MDQLLVHKKNKFVYYIFVTHPIMQPANGEFREETDTFNLSVVLTQDRLTVTLKDFVDWAIYSKEYTEEDIGGAEINRRMDLSDVFSAFSQTKANCDEASMREQEDGVAQLKHYEFGSVVQHEGNLCYKIERRGSITVYLVIIDKKTKKEVTYESKLALAKVRDMTEMEILGERADIQKKNIFDELSKKIEKQSARIASLQEQNTRLKQSFEQKISQMQEVLQQQKQQHQQHHQQLTQQVQQQQQQIQQLSVQSSRSDDKFAQLEPIFTAIRYAATLHSLPQPQSSAFFTKDGLKVQLTKYDSYWSHYIFYKPIGANESAKFKLRVTKTQSRDMLIGVVDYAKQKDQRSSFNSGNALSYYGSNGQKYPGGAQEGDGFKEGDVVEVEVNRANSTVKYSVNGTPKATHSNNILADNTRVFHPFFEVWHLNEAVEWLIY